MENIYYVYSYLDPAKPGKFIFDKYQFDFEPFYIGKGKKSRAYCHWKKVLNNNGIWTNLHFKNKLYKLKSNNIQPIIKIIDQNLSDKNALKIEEILVDIIGRSHLNQGPLVNITKGGDGIGSYRIRSDKGKKRNPISKEGKERMRKAKLGISLSIEHKKHISEHSLGIDKTWTKESYDKSFKTKRSKWPSKEKVLESIDKFKTKTLVSIDLKISHPTLQLICNHYNIQINWINNIGGETKFKKKIRPNKEDVLKTLDELKSIKKVSAYFGFSPNTMKKIIAEYNIKYQD